MTGRTASLLLAVLAVATVMPRPSDAASPYYRGPVIRHEPVTVAAAGQPLVIRAVVTSEFAAIKSVTLFYGASKDAAPFKVPMRASGSAAYVGTIPAAMMTGHDHLSYYIEAMDDLDAASETPWQAVQIRSSTTPLPATHPATAQQPAAGSAPAEPARPFWKKPAVWIGGAALVAAGTVAALSSGGGGGGSGGGGSGTTTTNSGTYVGTVTESLQFSGGAASYSTRPVTFSVVSSGIVSSDNLRPGEHLEAGLVGSDFVMISNVSETNGTGQIRYVGTLLTGRIVGTVEGSVQNAAGATGNYSGNFYAIKQ